MFKKLPLLFMPVPSSFSLEGFQSGSFEGVGDTRRLRLEPGDYNAVVMGPWNEKSKLKQEKEYLICELMWQVDSPELQQRFNVDRLPPVRQSIFLDVTPGGGLDMGPFKNADLNLVLNALGLGQNGASWKFSDFVGKPARIKVEHRPNPKNPMDPYVNVTSVTKI